MQRMYPFRNRTGSPTGSTVDANRREHVIDELRRLGATGWDLRKGETRYLFELIHPDEQIGGIMYGRGREGSVLLVATNRRILYIDTKPLFKKEEDVSYESVMGVTWEWVVFRGTLILERSVGNFVVHTTHRKVAEAFRSYVELRCIEHSRQG